MADQHPAEGDAELLRRLDAVRWFRDVLVGLQPAQQLLVRPTPHQDLLVAAADQCTDRLPSDSRTHTADDTVQTALLHMRPYLSSTKRIPQQTIRSVSRSLELLIDQDPDHPQISNLLSMLEKVSKVSTAQPLSSDTELDSESGAAQPCPQDLELHLMSESEPRQESEMETEMETEPVPETGAASNLDRDSEKTISISAAQSLDFQLAPNPWFPAGQTSLLWQGIFGAVVSKLTSSQGESAGSVTPGCLLVAINGLSTAGENYDQTVGRIRSAREAAETISIRFARPDSDASSNLWESDVSHCLQNRHAPADERDGELLAMIVGAIYALAESIQSDRSDASTRTLKSLQKLLLAESDRRRLLRLGLCAAACQMISKRQLSKNRESAKQLIYTLLSPSEGKKATFCDGAVSSADLVLVTRLDNASLRSYALRSLADRLDKLSTTSLNSRGSTMQLVLQLLESGVVRLLLSSATNGSIQLPAMDEKSMLTLLARMAQTISYVGVEPCPEFFAKIVLKISRLFPSRSIAFLLRQVASNSGQEMPLRIQAIFALSHLARGLHTSARIIHADRTLKTFSDCIRNYTAVASPYAAKAALHLLEATLQLPRAKRVLQLRLIEQSLLARPSVLIDAAKREGDLKFSALILRFLRRLLQESEAVANALKNDRKAVVDGLVAIGSRGKGQMTGANEADIICRSKAIAALAELAAKADAASRIQIASSWGVLEKIFELMQMTHVPNLLKVCDAACGYLIRDVIVLQQLFRSQSRHTLFQLVSTGGVAVSNHAMVALRDYLMADALQPKVFEAKWLKRLRCSSDGKTSSALVGIVQSLSASEAAEECFVAACELLLKFVSISRESFVLIATGSETIQSLARAVSLSADIWPHSVKGFQASLHLLRLLCFKGFTTSDGFVPSGSNFLAAQDCLTRCDPHKGRNFAPAGSFTSSKHFTENFVRALLLAAGASSGGTKLEIQRGILAMSFLAQLSASVTDNVRILIVMSKLCVDSLLSALNSQSNDAVAAAQHTLVALFGPDRRSLGSALSISDLTSLVKLRKFRETHASENRLGAQLIAVRSNAVENLRTKLSEGRRDFVDPTVVESGVGSLVDVVLDETEEFSIRELGLRMLAMLEIQPTVRVLTRMSMETLIGLCAKESRLRSAAGEAICQRVICRTPEAANELLTISGGLSLLLQIAEEQGTTTAIGARLPQPATLSAPPIDSAATAGLTAARALATVLWLAPADSLGIGLAPGESGRGAAFDVLSMGGLKWVLALAEQSSSPADHLLVSRALATMCHSLPDLELQRYFLTLQASYNRHKHDTPVGTLVGSLKKMLVWQRQYSNHATEQDMFMSKDCIRECFAAFWALAKKEPSLAARLSLVRALCEELLRGGTTDKEVLRQARSCLYLLDPENPAALLSAAESEALPENWSPFTSRNQEHVEVPLPSNSPEANMCEWLINANIHKHGGARGRTSTGKEPSRFRVLSVRRIQNRPLFVNYAHRRSQMLAKYADSLQFTDGNEWLQGADRAVLTDEVLQKVGFGNHLLDRRVNEKFLFHGTDAKSAGVLKTQGFDNRVASLIGMFGGGSYFAENSSKSNQYIPGPEANVQGPFQMLICRVLLGDIHICIRYNQTKYRGIPGTVQFVRRPPNKLLSNATVSGDVYDSVMGECAKHGATAVPVPQPNGRGTKPGQPLRFREYVIYDASQAYPEYQVTFERED